MKNTKRNTKPNQTTNAVRHFNTGAARVVISDSLFGERFLGNHEFIVFTSEAEAREEISRLISCKDNSKVIDSWEIHVWRGDAWLLVSAGENPRIVAA